MCTPITITVFLFFFTGFFFYSWIYNISLETTMKQQQHNCTIKQNRANSLTWYDSYSFCGNLCDFSDPGVKCFYFYEKSLGEKNTDRRRGSLKASWRQNLATHVLALWGGEMAGERLQFHEMGIDDRLLKVANRLTVSLHHEWAVCDAVKL